MNETLTTILQRVFNLTDQEFSSTLTREEIPSWDSLRHMDLVATLENEYDITLDMREILSIKSLPDVQEVLKGKGVAV